MTYEYRFNENRIERWPLEVPQQRPQVYYNSADSTPWESAGSSPDSLPQPQIRAQGVSHGASHGPSHGSSHGSSRTQLGGPPPPVDRNTKSLEPTSKVAVNTNNNLETKTSTPINEAEDVQAHIYV